MQHCDSTCHYCANEFWKWWKDRIKKQERTTGGRSGDGSFGAAAATSVRPSRSQ